MHSRCKPVYKQAADYFDRGIRVCDRWSDYPNFLADMGEKPENMTLDRIDNDAGYSPENCRWADMATQRRNQRRVIIITHQGVEMVLKDAAKAIGVTDTAVHQERYRNGGTFQDAFDRVLTRRTSTS